ncbi:MAG: sodium-independent anion transporter [Clostridia bacterium]|nr:sodium-independent anion transporter [Clostridia bacterium]
MKFTPALFECMRSYSKSQLVKDIIAGIIVAIIALPLSIALAIASGVGPQIGLYTAIVAGFLISLLGGSRVQIAGPTAAFAGIVAGIVAEKGMNGLVIATLMAGAVLVLMGLLRLGGLIRFIPHTITVGFTSGIALTILIGQLKDFFGLTFTHSPVETVEKIEEVFATFSTVNLTAVAVGVASLLILILLPKLLPKVPASLVAVIIMALAVKLFSLDVNTIGSLYPDMPLGLPKLALPSFEGVDIVGLIPDAVTIAVLAAVESLLSCVVADKMIDAKHNSNVELVAQGVGNIGSALFGGIPATGAIARTAANIKNGGRTPIAGMVHAIMLLGVLAIFMPYASLIPMPTIAAVLFVVAYNMSEWREFVGIVKKPSLTDTFVLILTFVLTVVFDLVVAIAVGLVVHYVIFFIKKIGKDKNNG